MKVAHSHESVETYINEVLRKIQAPPVEKQRMGTDLRAHIQAALEAGENAQSILERMGTPTDVASAFMSETSLRYASFWMRLMAALLDMLFIFAGAALLAILGITTANQVPQTIPDQNLVQLVLAVMLVLYTLGAGFGVIGLILLYFPILEGRFGTTPGKRLFRLKVLKENGLPIGYKEAFLRRLSYYFEFLPVDMLFIFFTEKRQRAMDIVARTIVIQE